LASCIQRFISLFSEPWPPPFGAGVLSAQNGITPYLARFDLSGNLVWAQLFSGTGDRLLNSVVADYDNHTVATGDFRDSICLGGLSLESDNEEDVFLIEFNK